MRQGARQRLGATAAAIAAVAAAVATLFVFFLVLPIPRASGRAAGQEPGEPSAQATIDSDTPTGFFLEANALYAEGSYREAAEAYEEIAAAGFDNADVLYNLGNAHYKDGEIGRAVLAYERALLLKPAHADAASNLEFVRELLADRQTAVGGPFSGLLVGIRRWATAGRLAVVASVFYAIAVVFAIVAILRGAFAAWIVRTIVVCGIVVVVVGAALGVRIYRDHAVRGAVVTAPEVAVRTGPGTDFVLEFQLHEGTKVRLREGRDDWVRVSVPGTDLEGWLPSDAVEAIEWRS